MTQAPTESSYPPGHPTGGRRLRDKPSDESLKETFESVIIAFILAFVFRAYVVEAFVIPTGSMAPTLLGQHLHTTCPQCGYTFNVDAQSRPRDMSKRPINAHVICPMCHFPSVVAASTPASAGDRILVHKYVYNIVEPSRWDVVVFKEPANPSENFIKRLIGLPGEKIWIVEGNIYVQPAHDGSGEPGKWRIARKSDARLGDVVQRDLWQPIYHSQYVPLDGGQLSRQRQAGDLNFTWQNPWSADQPDHWQMQQRRSYHHDQASLGTLRFDMKKALDPLQSTWYPYNQFHMDRQDPSHPVVPAEDIRLSAFFQPSSPGLSVMLSTQARTNAHHPDEAQDITAVIDAQGNAWLEATGTDGSTLELTTPVRVGQLPAGQSTQVELWYVDQEASLWIDGRRVAAKRFDMPMNVIVSRNALRRLPQPTIQVQGAPVTLHQVEVDRDIHYTSTLVNGSLPGLGALVKHGRERQGRPVTLLADQFFCLGDNSPLSSDGRFWNSVNPWISRRMLANSDQKTGIVPRKLMMGRAFFVYFPATYPIKPGKTAIIPNFGDLRFIH